MRSPKLFAGYATVKNIIGEETARKMVYDLPKDIETFAKLLIRHSGEGRNLGNA